MTAHWSAMMVLFFFQEDENVGADKKGNKISNYITRPKGFVLSVRSYGPDCGDGDGAQGRSDLSRGIMPYFKIMHLCTVK